MTPRLAEPDVDTPRYGFYVQRLWQLNKLIRDASVPNLFHVLEREHVRWCLGMDGDAS